MTTQRLFVHAPDREVFGPALDPAALCGLSARALVLAEPSDHVVLEAPADEDFLAFLGEHGRGPGRVHVPGRGARGAGLIERLLADEALLAELRASPRVIEPYASGPAERRLAAALDAPLHGSADDLAQRVNHKAALVDWLERADLRGVPTVLARRDELVARAAASRADGPLILRADVGIAGLGVWIVRTPDDLEALPAALDIYASDDLFLVQRLLPVRSSPNVQFDLTDAGATLVGVSEQRLRDGIRHTGNRWPLRDDGHDEVLRQACALAEVLARAGYRGFLGVDLVITADDEVFVIEVNPRLNTSSFGLLVLGDAVAAAGGAWLSLTQVPVPGATGFAELAERVGSEGWWRADRAGGVFPVLPPSPGRPRADVVLVDRSPEAVADRADALLARLGATR